MTDRFTYYISQVGIWSINPYQGCTHRCHYCIARSQGESIPWFTGNELRSVLESRLAMIPDDTELFIGALVDAYQPIEQELAITRLVLEEIIRQKRPFCINTKSNILCREIDLLSSYEQHCDVYLSLCTTNEEIIQLIEPGAPSAAQRIETINRLYEAGIDINIDAAPWIPGISDTRELISLLPPGAKIQFAPLDLHHCGGRLIIRDYEYTQDEIYAAYENEIKVHDNCNNVIWKSPMSFK